MPSVGDPDRHKALRRLPAVGALLTDPQVAPLIARHGRVLVTDAARYTLAATRDQIGNTGREATVTAEDVARTVEQMTQRSLRRVLNATGVILHTNLGRAPLAAEALAAIDEVARGYSSLELELSTGERGDRHRHVSDLVAAVTGAESATVFNNNAGAVLLMLAALCRGREVIVARGQLVEIGGGFRVPDVMRESGATLVEVGTTNRVYARDYEAAITERTAALLEVHRSNFAIVGFTAEPETRELAALSRARGLPLLVDLGSGLLAEPDALGEAAGEVSSEPRPAQLLAAGADLVAFSGDKLLGGPQAGIIAGRRAPMESIRRHPLARALRADKLTLAALEATLRLYRDGRSDEIPAVRMLATSEATLTHRAGALADVLRASPGLEVEVTTGEGLTGGGSLPLARLPARLVLAGGTGEEARALEAELRRGAPPVITRVVKDRVALDVRTIEEEEVALLGSLVRAAWERSRRASKEEPR